MTPNEILGAYDPAFGDRATRSGQPVTRGGEITERPRRTDRGKNVPERAGPYGGLVYRRREKDFRTEKPGRTWKRKLDEATESGLVKDWSPSLVKPISLSVDVHSPEGNLEVTGGHHRIVAADMINPDMLLPVVHHKGSVKQAQELMKGYGGYF
jgi:hypothetical protein